MIKIFGICILLFAFFLATSDLTKRRSRRLLILEELLRFCTHARVQISCFLRPPSELWVGFESVPLSECGFLGSLKEQKGLSAAYSEIPDALRPRGEADRILRSLFSSVGTGYLKDELELLDTHVAELSAIVERQRHESPKEARLIRTIGAAISLGFVIFII